MSRQFWSETLAWSTAAGTAVANTTDETALASVTVPANYMSDGRILRLKAFGKLSTTVTPTITFAVRWGGAAGVLLATTEAITNGSTVTNVNWSIEVLIQLRTNGATGTAIAMGEAKLHTSATAIAENVFGVSGYDAPATATVDLTTDKALVLTADWSAASASNTINTEVFVLESLN